MDSLSLRLAGHTLEVSCPGIETHFQRCGGFDRFRVDAVPAEWAVRYGVDVAPWSDAVLLSEFDFDELQCRCRFLRKGDDYQFLMLPASGSLPLVCMRYRQGARLVEASPCSDSSALRFSLWFACSMLGADCGVTFVHSAVVVCRGRAVLFLGESGTGKSTHARLWRQHVEDCHVLNDDSPFLALSPGGLRVYGSPWSGKSPVFHTADFPVAAVVRLSQAPSNRIRRLSVPEAFAALQPSMPPALMQDNESVVRFPDGGAHRFFADSLMDILSDTLSVVPVFHLQCLPDPSAALCCRDALGQALAL